ncbi:MAG: hypothetical protein KAJ16_10950 [Calditrichia bacterium]|nr:hypothetical protein [Calditrichia bacterium]
MQGVIGIRYENKDLTERRTPLNPDHVKRLIEEYHIQVKLEPSDTRIYPDEEYAAVGATITPDLSGCNIIFGVKEIPTSDLNPQQTYCFFSHTIKGQSYNMPMLKRILNLKDTLLDYEKVTDNQGRRLIFFGKYAGYAGMINSLWILGLRLHSEGWENPFRMIQQAMGYPSLEKARLAVKETGRKIAEKGLPDQLVPFICGFAGYGHVSQGAQEIFDLLPVAELQASQLEDFVKRGEFSNNKIYKVVFKEEDLVRRKDGEPFQLQDYYDYPEKYLGIFSEYIPYLTLLINGIYWEPRYPRLVTRSFLKKLFKEDQEPRLRVIGDITCDVDGSVESTVKATNSLNPIYVYDPVNEKIKEGHKGRGIVMMAVDKLPSELPREASDMFGDALFPYIAGLARTDFNKSFDSLNISDEFRDAIIAHQGRLAPDYQYIKEFIR